MERTWCKQGPGADLLIKGGRVVDPASGLDAVRDVLVRDGAITEVGEQVAAPDGVRVIDAAGQLVLPGFIDLHTHLRTPGHEDAEDLVTEIGRAHV